MSNLFKVINFKPTNISNKSGGKSSFTTEDENGGSSSFSSRGSLRATGSVNKELLS